MEGSILVSSNYSSNVTVTSNFFPTLACLLAVYKHGIRDYTGYKVLRVDVPATNSSSTFSVLNNIYLSNEFEFWTPPSRSHYTDILVSPNQIKKLEDLLSISGIGFKLIMEDVEENIKDENNNSKAADNSGMNWTKYHRLTTIYKWMLEMARKHPGLVSVETIGFSSENRPIKILKISKKDSLKSKPAVWMDGGIHAREWISPATATCLANKIIQALTNERKKEPDQLALETFDWYIAPVINPDGYEYSHTTDRLWRKTRSLEYPEFGECCQGVDANRNFDYAWGGKDASRDPCSSTYIGPHSSSEPEVAHVEDYIYNIRHRLKLYLAFHSFGQKILLPPTYSNVSLNDNGDLLRVGTKAAKKLGTLYGTKYEVGGVAQILYPASGSVIDWTFFTAGIKYPYAFELRDTGKYGFLLPAMEILPTCEETLEAVKSMVKDIISLDQ